MIPSRWSDHRRRRMREPPRGTSPVRQPEQSIWEGIPVAKPPRGIEALAKQRTGPFHVAEAERREPEVAQAPTQAVEVLSGSSYLDALIEENGSLGELILAKESIT